MKLRSDFVSNSSSSSFIVIANNGVDDTDDIKSEYSDFNEDWRKLSIPNVNGQHEFGWDVKQYTSFEDKMNFIGIQLLQLKIMATGVGSIYYKKNPVEEFERCYGMLQKVCKEKFGFLVTLNEELFTAYIYKNGDKYKTSIGIQHNYYIDHQSCVAENQCMEMFESEDALYNFLKFRDSYIQGGNDNA